MVIIVAQTTVFHVNATEPKQITMTLQPNEKITITMAGSGTIIIDWGDGSASETYTLLVYIVDYVRSYSYSHDYSVEFYNTSLTITITGENITHLRCNNLGLTGLDVSKNTELTDLWCYNNQLTSLDISKNTALTSLFCGNNQLTSLDITKNIALTDLFCYNNQLTSLDVSKNHILNRLWCNDNLLTSLDLSKNTTLYELCCKNNQLTTVALNELFKTLHGNTTDNWKRICILDNPGIDTCNQSIVINKGWTVTCPDNSVDSPPLFKRKSAEEGFREYIRRNTVYPNEALQKGIEGTVFVEFTVDQRGRVVDAKLILGVHPLLNAEAMRVVQSSPKWKPGIQWGKEVKVKYTFPFVFKMR